VALGLGEALSAFDQLASARGERFGHRVEHVRELTELVAPAIVQAYLEVASGDCRCGGDRLAQRIGDDTRQPEAEQDQQHGREHERDDARDGRLVGQLSRRRAAVGRDRRRVPGDGICVRDDRIESMSTFKIRLRRADRRRLDLRDPNERVAVVVDVRADLLTQPVRAPRLLRVARRRRPLERS